MFRKRFDREAGAAARVEHTRVVAVLDTGENGGIPYMAQEFIARRLAAGQDRARRARSSCADAVRVCLEVASGLDALHAAAWSTAT